MQEVNLHSTNTPASIHFIKVLHDNEDNKAVLEFSLSLNLKRVYFSNRAVFCADKALR